MAIRSDINWRVMAHSGKKAYPECKGCSNVSDEGYCIYILKNGSRRPCKPGPRGGCAVKDTESERGVIPPPIFPGSRIAQKRAPQKPLDPKRALELYKKGSTDAHIAASLNSTRGAVAKWRKRNNLPSNFNQGRIPKHENQ